MSEKVKVGIVGCGNISGIYFQNLVNVFNNVEVVACADMDTARSQAKADEFEGVKAVTVDELMADPEIKIVVNLTTPQAHFNVAKRALKSGKSVHNEKPLTLSREEGQELVDLAKKNGLLLGCAPDTFLGGGIQTCRKLIDDGWIGDPVAAQGFMLCPGHESWHPDPEFYYKLGGGPMFDMGPYYLTALVFLLGPVKKVTGATKITFPERTITSEKKFGKKVKVEVPTHVVAVMEFESGATVTLTTSFDVCGAHVRPIEIFGSQGSLSVPDPNGFGGPVEVLRAGAGQWSAVPVIHGYTENSRGIGVADMAQVILDGKGINRSNGDLAFHVLDIMHAVHDAAHQGVTVELASTCAKPEPMPLTVLAGEVRPAA
jgi:predicted dehydrogenase